MLFFFVISFLKKYISFYVFKETAASGVLFQMWKWARVQVAVWV